MKPTGRVALYVKVSNSSLIKDKYNDILKNKIKNRVKICEWNGQTSGDINNMSSVDETVLCTTHLFGQAQY